MSLSFALFHRVTLSSAQMAASEIRLHSEEDEDVASIHILGREIKHRGPEPAFTTFVEASDSLGLGPALSILLRLDSNTFHKISLMQHITRENKHLGTQ